VELPEVRVAVVNALAKFSKQEDMVLLCELTNDTNPDVRASAVKALRCFSKEEDLRLLRELARGQNSSERVVVAAVKALASFSRQEDLLLFRDLALTPNDDVAAEAVRGLAARSSREGLEAFLIEHDQKLCGGALAALDKLLYVPAWLKTKDR
jgi:HEAT repeat protein